MDKLRTYYQLSKARQSLINRNKRGKIKPATKFCEICLREQCDCSNRFDINYREVLKFFSWWMDVALQEAKLLNVDPIIPYVEGVQFVSHKDYFYVSADGVNFQFVPNAESLYAQHLVHYGILRKNGKRKIVKNFNPRTGKWKSF